MHWKSATLKNVSCMRNPEAISIICIPFDSATSALSPDSIQAKGEGNQGSNRSVCEEFKTTIVDVTSER